MYETWVATLFGYPTAEALDNDLKRIEGEIAKRDAPAPVTSIFTYTPNPSNTKHGAVMRLQLPKGDDTNIFIEYYAHLHRLDK